MAAVQLTEFLQCKHPLGGSWWGDVDALLKELKYRHVSRKVPNKREYKSTHAGSLLGDTLASFF